MAAKRTKSKASNAHRFGGDWTTSKLDVLAQYLSGYTTALKDTPFKKAYIDAFAGTGYREARDDEAENETDASQGLLFPDLAGDEPQALLDGSARLALKTKPPFDHYMFIERSAKRCADLELLKTEFPDLASKIQIKRGDANKKIQELCTKDWRSRRAVMFLDPYGMQVEWKTIEAIAGTRAIDLWVLFPLGIGVNRLLTKSSKIPPEWRRRLNLLLGREDWYDEFYRVEKAQTLFGDEDRIVKATTDVIGRYFNTRLKSVFAAVADEPKVLRNSANCPLYLLCFAAANEKGAPIALKIANHVLTKGV
jgi:three-Cys-motif partner protein